MNGQDAGGMTRAEIEKAVDSVIAESERVFRRLVEGEKKLLGLLLGSIMRATGGQADAKVASEIIHERVEAARRLEQGGDPVEELPLPGWDDDPFDINFRNRCSL